MKNHLPKRARLERGIVKFRDFLRMNEMKVTAMEQKVFDAEATSKKPVVLLESNPVTEGRFSITKFIIL